MKNKKTRPGFELESMSLFPVLIAVRPCSSIKCLSISSPKCHKYKSVMLCSILKLIPFLLFITVS